LSRSSGPADLTSIVLDCPCSSRSASDPTLSVQGGEKRPPYLGIQSVAPPACTAIGNFGSWRSRLATSTASSSSGRASRPRVGRASRLVEPATGATMGPPHGRPTDIDALSEAARRLATVRGVERRQPRRCPPSARARRRSRERKELAELESRNVGKRSPRQGQWAAPSILPLLRSVIGLESVAVLIRSRLPADVLVERAGSGVRRADCGPWNYSAAHVVWKLSPALGRPVASVV